MVLCGVMQRWPSVTIKLPCLAYGAPNDKNPNSRHDHIATFVLVRRLSCSKAGSGAALRWKTFGENDSSSHAFIQSKIQSQHDENAGEAKKKKALSLPRRWMRRTHAAFCPPFLIYLPSRFLWCLRFSGSNRFHFSIDLNSISIRR